MSRPRISGKRVWQNHECRVLRVFKRALELLGVQSDLDICEDGLNRKLYFCILRANDELHRQGLGFDWPPVLDSKNAPDASDEERAAREDKRPDFQWGFFDHSEPDPDRQGKYYIIECKRLGEPRSKGWVFNRSYVWHGILRFVRREHGYGKSAPSGAMVGYIRSMPSTEILREVNECAREAGLSEIELSCAKWVNKGVSRLDQELDRPDVPPTPFSLRHLWVDFREE